MKAKAGGVLVSARRTKTAPVAPTRQQGKPWPSIPGNRWRISRSVALPAAAILLCAATAGHAAEPVATGYNVVNCQSEMLDLGEGRSYTQFAAKGIMLSVEGQPNHMTNLECMGSFEKFPDETFKVSGYCRHTDRDGDWWTDRFWHDSSMDQGRFELTGGVGKWPRLLNNSVACLIGAKL